MFECNGDLKGCLYHIFNSSDLYLISAHQMIKSYTVLENATNISSVPRCAVTRRAFLLLMGLHLLCCSETISLLFVSVLFSLVLRPHPSCTRNLLLLKLGKVIMVERNVRVFSSIFYSNNSFILNVVLKDS